MEGLGNGHSSHCATSGHFGWCWKEHRSTLRGDINGVCPSPSPPTPSLTPGAGDLRQRPALPLGRAEFEALQVQLPLGLEQERKPHFRAEPDPSEPPGPPLRASSKPRMGGTRKRLIRLQNPFWEGLPQHPAGRAWGVLTPPVVSCPLVPQPPSSPALQGTPLGFPLISSSRQLLGAEL